MVAARTGYMAEELSDIDGLGPKTIESLNSLGIESLDELAQADPSVVNGTDVKISESRMEGYIEQASLNTVQIQTGSDVVEEYEQRTTYSLDIPELDAELGGGLDAGEIVAVGGDTGSGKTQLAFYALGRAVRETGDPALYIETEPDRYRGERVRQMFDKSVQQDIHKIKAYGLDQQKNAYRAVMDSDTDYSMVVVDSFTSRFRLSDRFEDRSSFGERNQEFREHLNLVEDMGRLDDVPVLLVCQVYKSPDQYGADDVIYGSTLMMHMVAYVIMMQSRSGQLTEANLRNNPHGGDASVLLQINDGGLEYAE